MNRLALFCICLLTSFLPLTSAFAAGDTPLANSADDLEYVLRSETCNHLIADSQCDQKPHVVFFVHGLTGKDATFHELHKGLMEEYGHRKNLLVYSIDYPTDPRQHGFLKLNKADPKQANYMKTVEDRVAKLHPLHFARIMNTKIRTFLYNSQIKNTNECRSRFSGADQQVEQENCMTNIVTMDTEYSLVVHSQGGLASMVYLNTCLDKEYGDKKCSFDSGTKTYEYLFNVGKKEEREKVMNAIKPGLYQAVVDSVAGFKEHKNGPPQGFDGVLGKIGDERAPNIKNMVSLGSPFWGSPTANKGVQLEALLDVIHQMTSVPSTQVIQLAIGSRGLSWQRNLMLRRSQIQDDGTWTNHYPEDFRVFNVAGVIQNNGVFDKPIVGDLVIDWFLNSQYHENDIIVAAPEARLDFIYYLENQDNGKHGPLRGRTNSVDSYHPFDMSHVPLGPWKDSVDGMTVYLMDNDQYQSNSAFSVIKMALNTTFDSPEYNREAEEKKLQSKYVGKLSNFTSEIKLVTPRGYHRPISIIEEDIEISPAQPERFEAKKLENKLTIRNHAQNNYAEKVKHYYWQTYYHVGKMAPKWAFYPRANTIDKYFEYTNGGNKIKYSFSPLGFQPKEFRQNVVPSYTSYAELFLNPYLPVSPAETANYTESNQGLKLGAVNVSATKVREFYLDSASRRLVAVVKPKPEGKDKSVCNIGIAGVTTTSRFRHTVKAGMSSEDRDINGSSIVKFDKKVAATGEVMTAEFNGTEYPVGAYLWNKYARNTNQLFGLVDEPTFNSAQPNLNPYRVPTGTVVEILGRVAEGGMRDTFARIHRECSPDEVDSFPNACSVPHVDRYLVTSDKIRETDGLKSISEVGIIGEKGRMLGLRWMNTVDVDMLKEHDKLPVREKKGVDKSIIVGNKCLDADSDKGYLGPGSMAGYFYRDLESEVLGQKVFAGFDPQGDVK